MPLNGTGTFAPIEPEFPAIPETTILASEFNTIITDISEALSLSIYKDGQAVVLANIDWGNNKIVNLAAGTNDKDAVNFDQVFHNPTFVGSIDDGIILSGTKTTINSAWLEINSDVTTIDSANIDIHATDNFIITSDSILNLESPSITLDALNDINLLSALTTINSPNIVLTGNTLATLNTNTTAITQPLADSSTKLATTAYVNNKIVSQTFPVGVDNNHKLLSQDAGVAIWSDKIDSDVIEFMDGVDNTKQFKLLASSITPATTRSLIIPDANTTLLGTDTSQTITNKTMTIRDSAFQIYDNVDTTKRLMFECASIGTGQTRVITMPNENIVLGDSGSKLLQTFTSPGGSNTWEILPTIFDATYNIYIFEFWNLTINAGTSISFLMQYRSAGVYITANYLQSADAFTASSVFNFVDAVSTPASFAAGYVRFYSPGSTSMKKMCMFTSSSSGKNTTRVVDTNLSGNTTTAALDGFKLVSSGAALINAGAIGKLYGLK